MSPSIVVKTYKNDRDFEKDAAKMAAGGYAVQAQSGQRGRVLRAEADRLAYRALPLGRHRDNGLAVLWRPFFFGDAVTVNLIPSTTPPR